VPFAVSVEPDRPVAAYGPRLGLAAPAPVVQLCTHRLAVGHRRVGSGGAWLAPLAALRFDPPRRVTVVVRSTRICPAAPMATPAATRPTPRSRRRRRRRPAPSPACARPGAASADTVRERSSRSGWRRPASGSPNQRSVQVRLTPLKGW